MATPTSALPQDPTRGIRPPNYDGRREAFESWAFQFEAYGGLLGWTTLLEAAVQRQDTPVVLAEQAEETIKISAAIYHILAQCVRGPALSILKLTPRGQGLEAVRRLYREYRPQIEEDFAEVLATILKPTWWHERRAQPFTVLFTRWD